jgi:hypothetical protein
MIADFLESGARSRISNENFTAPTIHQIKTTSPFQSRYPPRPFVVCDFSIFQAYGTTAAFIANEI